MVVGSAVVGASPCCSVLPQRRSPCMPRGALLAARPPSRGFNEADPYGTSTTRYVDVKELG